MQDFITLPAVIHKISTMADGSIRLVLDTRELGAAMMAKLFDMRNKEGWFLFSPSPFKDSTPIPEGQPEIGNKTPSERLRNVLYRVWESGTRSTPFEQWRVQEMETIITQQKERIER